MNLTPTEMERLTIFTAAELARRNLREGVPLSHPEAVAYLTDEIMLAARKDMPFDELVDHAHHLLTAEQVMGGVPEMLRMLLVDAPFAEGTKLVSVVDPIAPMAGDIRPGEIAVGDEPVQLFPSVERLTLKVVNQGDRDVQVRSQTHFFEANPALEFDRRAAWGHKLAVAAGAGVRFEPGIPVTVELVPMAGDRIARGFAGLVNGPLDDRGVQEAAVTALTEQEVSK
ncbi:urease subunit beta [Saccharopolyspora sp. K220]|uniref:urease subunit beta n=1 Tax=Saccharopolyspora soli TaxID=2926618 RepID=UPI0027E08CB3|nr:urease subunit beta [Saccharopolyspora soli]MCI2421683.1 urease subunit beta [Saccharopolyspora soli]